MIAVSVGKMVIEKVHGLQATNISLNDRFTLLASTAPMTRVTRPRRRSSGFFSQGQNINNRALIDQIAQHFGQHARKVNDKRFILNLYCKNFSKLIKLCVFNLDFETIIRNHSCTQVCIC